MFKFFICTNEIISSFLLLYSVLVYHGYTDANLGPWKVRSLVSIFFLPLPFQYD